MTLRLDLWLWSLDCDAPRRAALSAHLSPDEHVRAARFVFDRDRHRFIAARGRMREILADTIGQTPAALAFTYNAHGKPALADAPPFNLSHSGGRAALVLSPGPEIGIDIEAPRKIEPALATRVFAPEEQRALEGLTGADWTAAFFRGWTRKEAFVKARGDGLTLPLDSFAVTIRATAPPRLTRIDAADTRPEDWRLIHLDLAPDLTGAIALHSPEEAQIIHHNNAARP